MEKSGANLANVVRAEQIPRDRDDSVIVPGTSCESRDFFGSRGIRDGLVRRPSAIISVNEDGCDFITALLPNAVMKQQEQQQQQQ